MSLSKKVLLTVLIIGLTAVAILVTKSNIFQEPVPSRAKKVLQMSRYLNGG